MRGLVVVLGLALLQAQLLPDTVEAGRLELQLEDQAESAPEGLDWTQLSDILQSRRPLDLNTASVRELLQIPGLTPQLIKQLRAYQKRYGALLSIYELQAVPGFTVDLIRQIQPFVRVRPATPYDFGEGAPQPPKLGQLPNLARFTFIQRAQRNYDLVGEGGHWQPETLQGAVGAPYRLYTRLWLQANPYLSAALIGEKDYYEPLRWQPNGRYYGYDFLSGHLMVGSLGRLNRLILGDYILQVGQGLVLARGLGFGKGGDPILTLKQPHYGLVPYTSVNEFQFWRGAVVSYQLSRRLEVIAFASRLRQDGTPTTIQVTGDEDTEAIAIRTLLASGLHRTSSELARRKNLLTTANGAVLTYRHRYTTLGGTILNQRFAPPLRLQGDAPYQRYNFTGTAHQLGSVFWDVTFGNVNTFGEVALSAQGAKAFTAALSAVLAPSLDVALQVRHFDVNFTSFYGYAYAERPWALQNEQGIYIGFRLRPHPKWELAGFYDLYRFPWYRYRAHGTTTGHENLLQLTYRPNRRFQAYARLRYETKPYDRSGDTAQWYRLIDHTRAYMRLHVLYQVAPQWRYQVRLERSLYIREERSRGYLLYQDIRWQPGFSWSLSVRWVVFRIQDYDARIYTYESMPPTTFFIPSYYGDGQRVYALLRCQIGRHWTIWLRGGHLLFRVPGVREFQKRWEGLLQLRYELKGQAS